MIGSSSAPLKVIPDRLESTSIGSMVRTRKVVPAGINLLVLEDDWPPCAATVNISANPVAGINTFNRPQVIALHLVILPLRAVVRQSAGLLSFLLDFQLA